MDRDHHQQLRHRGEDRSDHQAGVRVQDLRRVTGLAAHLQQLHQVVLLPQQPPGDLHHDGQSRAHPRAAPLTELHRQTALY